MKLHVARKNDLNKASRDLLATLTRHGVTIAFAESLTAGLGSSTLANNPGASFVLRGGAVVYHNEVKHTLLGVDLQHANEVEGVSEQVAREMAFGVQDRLGADIGVAFTGFATGGPSWDQHAWVAISTFVGGHGTAAFDLHPIYPMGRNEFREALVLSAYLYVVEEVLKGA